MMLSNESNEFNISASDLDLTCPSLTEWQETVIKNTSYYIEGVLQSSVAVVGIFINLISSIILTKKEMRNSFNLLLVTLAAYDSWYLFGAILESCRKFFQSMRSDTHIILFPYFLYPIHQTSMSGSIFMTVAIAFERFTAVHFPLDYNQAMNDDRVMRKRVAKYLIPVCVISFVFNIPKFFEAQIEFDEQEDLSSNDTSIEDANGTISDIMTPRITLTPMRTHPWYSNYNSWSRLFVLGIIPFILLVFFNAKIYRDITERRKRRLLSNGIAKANKGQELITRNPSASIGGQSIQAPEELPMVVAVSRPGELNVNQPIQITINDVALPSRDGMSVVSNEGSSQTRSLKKTACSIRKARKSVSSAQRAKKASLSCLTCIRGSVKEAFPVQTPPTLQVPGEMARPASSLLLMDSPVRNDSPTSLNGAALNQPASSSRVPRRNTSRRRAEDNLAVVFMAIILIFLVCHAPRILLDIRELATVATADYCNKAGRYEFKMWSLVLLNVSHFLLVVNSSVNMVVYCLLGSKFRAEVKKILDKLFTCAGSKYQPNNNCVTA